MLITTILVISIIAANLPWLTERSFLIFPPNPAGKSVWMRLGEWLVLYLIIGGIAIGLEIKATGGSHTQDWEFYWVSLFLFMIFALPGFIYRHDLVHLIERSRR